MIASIDFEEHLQLIGTILRTLRKNVLELRMSKCKFAINELDYLGYKANSSGISPSDHHIKTIKNYPMPQNAKQVQQCLGLFSFFRKCVPSFSFIEKSLTNLLKDKVPFHFDESCKNAFETTKQANISSCVGHLRS